MEEGEKAGSVSVGYLDATAGTVVGKFEVGEQIATYEGDKRRSRII